MMIAVEPIMRPLLLLSFLFLACASGADTAKREIEAQYARLAEAFEREDLEAVLSFRTPDFNTTGPDGRHLSYDEMVDYARGWFELNEPPIKTKFTVQDIEMAGSDEARVTVFQEASRRQKVEGVLRTVDHSVVQRETWVRTPAGWKIRKVDQVRDQRRWVDGTRVR